jgi:acetyl esterase/lipase
MSRLARTVLIAAVCGLSATFAIAENTPAARPATQAARPPAPPNEMARNTVAHLDVAYADRNSELNKLDIYAPKGAKGAPIVLFVHGGEWSRHDKQPVSYKPKFFNENGVIFITTNYRLSPKDPHPAQVDDVAEAVAFVHKHAGEYGGDPSKIVLMGHSAGCHIVTYVGLNPESLAKVGMKPSDLAGVVAWSGGMYDLADRYKKGGTYPPFIKATFGESEEAQRAGSPMTYTRNAKNSPPFLIASTDEAGKPQASRQASANLIAAINAAGGSAKPYTIQDRTHRAAIEQVGAAADKSGPALVEFVKSVTK